MSSTNDHAEGAMDRLKGKAKRVYGEIADDDQAKAEGSVDKLKGDVKTGKGDLKDRLKEKIDKI